MEDKILTHIYKFKINHFSDIWWIGVSEDNNISIGDNVVIIKDNSDFKKGSYAKVIGIEERNLTTTEILQFNKIVKI